MKRKILYGIRWQLSGIVLIPFVLIDPTFGIILGNAVGAILFWNIDKYLTQK